MRVIFYILPDRGAGKPRRERPLGPKNFFALKVCWHGPYASCFSTKPEAQAELAGRMEAHLRILEPGRMQISG
jgi:hypothetical protein